MAANSVCAIETCDKPAGTRGWCERHYGRWKRHGDPMFTKKRRRDSSDPFPVERRCSGCLAVKPLSAFSKCSQSGLGVRERCKDCCRSDGAGYRASNREKERRRDKDYRSRNQAKANERKRE